MSAVKLAVRIILAVCLGILGIPEISAQSGRVRSNGKSQTQGDQRDRDALRLRVEEVLLPVSLHSETGKLPAFDRNDFIVAEDGKRQQMTAVMRTPANILLLLDASGEASWSKDINVNRDNALRIVDSLGSEDQVAIITYGDKVNLISPWTRDKEELRHALHWKFRPGIRANFYNALQYAAEVVLPKVSGRRSIVILSDGVDANDNGPFEGALASLHRVRATVYVANPNQLLLHELKPTAFNPLSWYEMLDPAARKRITNIRRYYHQLEVAEVTLRSLAEETGGATWDCRTRDELKGVGAKIVAEIGAEYVLAYTSERPPDDKDFHLIKVFVDLPDVQVRTRRGIYPGPSNKPQS